MEHPTWRQVVQILKDVRNGTEAPTTKGAQAALHRAVCKLSKPNKKRLEDEDDQDIAETQ